MNLTLFARVAALIIIGFIINSFALKKQLFQGPVNEKDIEEKVDSVIALMTLEEKIGQMTLFTSDWDQTGPSLRENYKEDIQRGRVGAVFNAHSAAFTRELQRVAVEETRLGIPLLFGYDVIHGYKTIFPIPLAESASWDLEAMERSARVAAIEASAAGLHWTFAPMVDIARDPRWGRIAEGAGEDTYLGEKAAEARVRGFQGDDLGAVNTILACAKHFAAYGASQAGRDYHTVDISERVLREVYLPPFKAAVKAGVASFMTSFNELDGVPASGNKHLLTDVLREEWGFSGFVVSDYTSINEMIAHGVVANEKEAGALALNAGVDMDMQGAVFYNYLEDLLKQQKVDMVQIDQAVRSILSLKFQLGLFDDPYRYSNPEREKQKLLAKEHIELARDIARKSIVLLKNDRQVLPLNKNMHTLAVIGPLADNKSELIGSWSAAGDFNNCVSLLEGIQSKVGAKTNIVYAKGCDISGDSKAGFAEALALVENADAVVVAVGEAALMSGEAASRSELGLPGVQLELVRQLVNTGKPVVVVLMNGRPLTIPWMADNAPAILETWFLGTEAGNAIADVLFGDYNPSGKLTATFPRNTGQIPIYYCMKNTGRPMNAHNKYTSKYLDVPNDPLYHFGFGLSYTTFEYSKLKIDKEEFAMDESLQLHIELSNTGSRAGEEVVQLYIHDLVGSVTRPVKELKAFRKVFLKKGESKRLNFTLTADDLAFYTRDMSYKAEAGDFEIFVGGSSATVNSVRVRLKD